MGLKGTAWLWDLFRPYRAENGLGMMPGPALRSSLGCHITGLRP